MYSTSPPPQNKSHWHIPYLGYNEEKCHLSALDSGATGISARDLSTSTVATILGMVFSVLVAAAYRIRLKYFTTLEQHSNQVFMKELAGAGSGSGLGRTSVASMSGPATPSMMGDTDRGRKSAASQA